MTKQPYRTRVRQELASIHPLYAIPGKGEEAVRQSVELIARAESEGVSPRKCARLVMAHDLDRAA